MTGQINTDQYVKEKSVILEKRKKIGEAIRSIRENRGLSQNELAEKMNISRSTISKIEGGNFNFSIDYLSRFSLALGFEINVVQNCQNP